MPQSHRKPWPKGAACNNGPLNSKDLNLRELMGREKASLPSFKRSAFIATECKQNNTDCVVPSRREGKVSGSHDYNDTLKAI